MIYRWAAEQTDRRTEEEKQERIWSLDATLSEEAAKHGAFEASHLVTDELLMNQSKGASWAGKNFPRNKGASWAGKSWTGKNYNAGSRSGVLRSSRPLRAP